MRGRKLSASRESRRRHVEERRQRRREQDARRREAEAFSARQRAALARQPDSPDDVVRRLLRRQPEGPGAQKLHDLLLTVAERAPRLVADALPALKLIADAEWVRPPATWRPCGKSPDRVFRSLAEHVLARYPMPPFVWSAFRADDDAPVLARVVSHVANGGSLHQAVRSGLMPVPLTRAMCHELLSRGAEPRFLDAVRKVQVQAAGGDGRLFRAWIATRAGGRLHDRADEEFWRTVLSWMSANPMLPPAEVAPLADYVERRRAEEPGFSMKGRSVLALMRAMREWHGELAREKASAGRVFPASGLEPMDVDWSRVDARGRSIVEVWRFREVLDARTLADEGRAMGHCVYAYARSIAQRQCSIWTLTLRDNAGHWRRLTIEVRPAQRRIVQARGRFNRLPEPRDLQALDAWASRNALQLSLDRW